MMSDECKTCKRPVIWARHVATGKAAPIDLMPDPSGNVVLSNDQRDYLVLTKAEREQPATEHRYTNHWQTCPDREAWKGATSK